MIQTVDFDLIHSTAADFLVVFVGAGNYVSEVKSVGFDLLRLLSIEPTFHFKYTPEEMALGCLFLACTYAECTFKHTAHITPRITKFAKDFISYNIPELQHIQKTIKTKTIAVL